MKNILIFLSLFYIVTYAQPATRVPLLSEINIVPADSAYLAYYSYRIPSNSFVFVKDGKDYSANYRITIEVSDTASTFVDRRIDEKKIYTANFDETTSIKTFNEGVFQFKLHEGKYIFTTIVADLNSHHEYKLKPKEVAIQNITGKIFLKPIIINSSDNGYSGKFRLTNFAGDVPFSEEEYNFVFPCTDTSVTDILVEVISNSDTVYQNKLSDSFTSRLFFQDKNGSVIVSNGGQAKITKNFLLKGLSSKLPEGKLIVILSDPAKQVSLQKFDMKVEWFNKPVSLMNPENAIKFLEVIDKRSVVNELLSGNRDDYEKKLFNYWKKLDPTPNSQFNPLMEEYYERVDYALKHFYTLTRKRREIITDRSKVYIKYGEPSEIERAYNQYGKSIETWIYKKPSMKFNFLDTDGTGNFILVKNNE